MQVQKEQIWKICVPLIYTFLCLFNEYTQTEFQPELSVTAVTFSRTFWTLVSTRRYPKTNHYHFFSHSPFISSASTSVCFMCSLKGKNIGRLSLSHYPPIYFIYKTVQKISMKYDIGNLQ